MSDLVEHKLAVLIDADNASKSDLKRTSWSAEAFEEGGYEEFVPTPDQLVDMLVESFRKRPELMETIPTTVDELAEKMRMSQDCARRLIVELEKIGLMRRSTRKNCEG